MCPIVCFGRISTSLAASAAISSLSLAVDPAAGFEVQHVNRKSGLFGPTMLLTGHEGEAQSPRTKHEGLDSWTGDDLSESLELKPPVELAEPADPPGVLRRVLS